VRKTLARLGERKVHTPEEWKAWTQNLGHENEMTTFRSYGEVPLQRQTEIMRGFARNTVDSGIDDQIAKLEQIALVLRATAR